MHPTSLFIALSLAAMPLLVTLPATAQTPAPSRAEVKLEAKRAAKAGEIPSGEQGPKEAPFKASQTRAERKEKTKDAIAKGQLPVRGEASPPEAQPKFTKAGSRPRAEVKSETRAANKAGSLRVGESYPEKTR